MEHLIATSRLAGEEAPGLLSAGFRANDAPALAWLAVTPLWAVVSLGRVSAYAFDHRYRAIVAPVRSIALQDLLLWPLAVLGCWVTLRTWQRSGTVLSVVATLAPIAAFGGLAWPAHRLASLLLSGPGGRYLSVATLGPWLTSGVEYSARYASCVAVAVGAIAHRRWSVERKARLHAERMAALERLRTLRAQINPHFLFNALNSIVGLGEAADGQAMQDLMTDLSVLLRQTIAASEREEHTLGEELTYIATYLRIQGIRHTQLRSDISVDAGCRGARTPTLILMSLVENAVSHGLRGSSASILVEVQVECGGNSLSITVRNTAVVTAPPDRVLHQGCGLRLMRERLDLLYGDTATLRTVRPDPTHFEALLILPQNRGPQPTVAERPL